MINAIKVLFALAFLIVVYFLMFWQWLTIPYVVKSYSTNKCLFVEYSDGQKTDCTVLPKRYELKWAK